MSTQQIDISSLFHFIQNDQFEEAKTFLSKYLDKFDINSYFTWIIGDDGETGEKESTLTPLYLATKLKRTPFIQLFLDNGSDSKKVVFDDCEGLFVSAYDYAILTKNESLKKLFSKYSQQGQMLSTRTKTRSKNTPVFDFASNKTKRGRKPKSKEAIGMVQSF